MEIAKMELDAIEQALTHPAEVIELAELELTLIGGGMGDVSFG